MSTKILWPILWTSSLLFPGHGLLAAEKSNLTVFFTSENAQFSLAQKGEEFEWLMIATGRVRERHAGTWPATTRDDLEKLITRALATLGHTTTGHVLERDTVIGAAFYFIAAGGQQVAGNEREVPAAITGLLEWVRRHGPVLPPTPVAGLYMVAYPIAATPPSTPFVAQHSAPELAAAVAHPFQPVRVTDPQRQNSLPREESEFTLAGSSLKFFEVYYLEGAPFSLEQWLAPSK